MKSRSGRVLGWKNICHPSGKFFRPTKNVTLKEQITWKHLAGASEYIYPELDSTEVLEIKDKTGVSKLTLFPVLRERWGFNTGVTGWKENIEYLGSEVDKSRLYPLRDSGRFVLVYDRSELSSLPPEDIKKLMTATCSQTRRWRMKMNPKKKINLSDRPPFLLPIWFLMEGENEKFTLSSLWEPDFDNPCVCLSSYGKNKPEVKINLRYPDFPERLSRNLSTLVEAYIQ